MSYGRNPHYIWSDGGKLYLNTRQVPENLINAFLYKVLLQNRREELARRLKEGKQEWLKILKPDMSTFDIIELPEDNPEVIACKSWMENLEDDLLKYLMGEKEQDNSWALPFEVLEE